MFLFLFLLLPTAAVPPHYWNRKAAVVEAVEERREKERERERERERENRVSRLQERKGKRTLQEFP